MTIAPPRDIAGRTAWVSAEGARDVDGHHPLPDVQGVVGQRAPDAQEARVVDEHVHAPEDRDGLRRRRAYGLGVGQVELDGVGVRAALGEPREEANRGCARRVAVTTSRPPSAATASATARPMPLDAPVTMTRAPSRRPLTALPSLLLDLLPWRVGHLGGRGRGRAHGLSGSVPATEAMYAATFSLSCPVTRSRGMGGWAMSIQRLTSPGELVVVHADLARRPERVVEVRADVRLRRAGVLQGVAARAGADEGLPCRRRGRRPRCRRRSRRRPALPRRARGRPPGAPARSSARPVI